MINAAKRVWSSGGKAVENLYEDGKSSFAVTAGSMYLFWIKWSR